MAKSKRKPAIFKNHILDFKMSRTLCSKIEEERQPKKKKIQLRCSECFGKMTLYKGSLICSNCGLVGTYIEEVI